MATEDEFGISGDVVPHVGVGITGTEAERLSDVAILGEGACARAARVEATSAAAAAAM